MSAQKPETFDIISFKTPKGWQKQVSQNAVQLGVDDSATGGSCLITMFKPLPGSSDSKVNFEAVWENIVKEAVSVSGKPQMESPVSENGCKFSVPNNWQVTFSSIEGKPRTYNASFAAVKSARILWLDGTAFGKVN